MRETFLRNCFETELLTWEEISSEESFDDQMDGQNNDCHKAVTIAYLEHPCAQGSLKKNTKKNKKTHTQKFAHLQCQTSFSSTCEHEVDVSRPLDHTRYLTLLLLNTTCPILANSVDPGQLAYLEANWSGSALFVIKYVNFYQKPGSSNLTGWKLEVGVAS